jgi:hypothetical protein
MAACPTRQYKAGMSGVNRAASTGYLASLCAMSVAGTLALLAGCGSESCEQDYPPPEQIATSDNPYRISYRTSNVGISQVRWENVTTGDSGTASLEQKYECVPFIFFPPICGDWLHVTMDIPLIPGANTVHTYEASDGCEWRDDYVITLD